MPKALIISLGGSLEPIVKSIKTHRPELVLFFASEESIEQVSMVKELLGQKGIRFRNKNLVVNDAQDLITCYKKALSVSDWVVRHDIPPDQVVVDYTGGTKTMTAALTLATVARGYRFSYVGGKERTKDGLGVVLTGREEIKTSLSPWQLLAVEEKKRIAIHANSYQFDAAIHTLRTAKSRAGTKETELFDNLTTIFEGYSFWERFDHRLALRRLEDGCENLSRYIRISGEGELVDFSSTLEDNLGFLKRLKEHTSGFKTLHEDLVLDLISNAGRRIEEGKYDDAVARLYRALEMIGQVEFEKTFGCPTSDVKPDQLPSEIKDEYTRRYAAEDGRLKLPLLAAFQALKLKGNAVAKAFFSHQEEFRNLLQARNNSILAHGQIPIAQQTCQRFMELMVNTFEIKDAITFPKLKW
ncbi:MAG TPA: TIGR02710 family CRISPR-associated protein [Candidatus Latescibacteria bacterium]|nr:TIGR02710 family CRISPR-associated protein [Candidatus Latescibacterota bacterium]